jgi:hypothetical protein
MLLANMEFVGILGTSRDSNDGSRPVLMSSPSPNLPLDPSLRPINPIVPVKFEDGSIWMGGVSKSGSPQGWGELRRSQREYYQGVVSNGVLQGYGTYYWSDDTFYFGDWSGGKRHGHGTFCINETGSEPSLISHVGTWVNDELLEYDRTILSDGSVWQGPIDSGWDDGDNGDKNTGYGIWQWKNGDYYEGDALTGRIHGRGLYKWTDGEIYEGDWINGQRHGFGIDTYPDGTSHRGYWIEDVFQGADDLYDDAVTFVTQSRKASEEILMERFNIRYERAVAIIRWMEMDGFVSSAEEGEPRKVLANAPSLKLDDGSEWMGGLDAHGTPHGEGRWNWPNGDEYVGEVSHGFLSGQGTYVWGDGDHYQGTWQNGKRHGHGVFTYADGSELSGHWQEDTFADNDNNDFKDYI